MTQRGCWVACVVYFFLLRKPFTFFEKSKLFFLALFVRTVSEWLLVVWGPSIAVSTTRSREDLPFSFVASFYVSNANFLFVLEIFKNGMFLALSVQRLFLWLFGLRSSEAHQLFRALRLCGVALMFHSVGLLRQLLICNWKPDKSGKIYSSW